MPLDLLKPHQALDREVEKAHRPEAFKDDDERISYLFSKYMELSQ